MRRTVLMAGVPCDYQNSLSYGIWSQGGVNLNCQPFSTAQLLELWYGILEARL